MASPQLLITDGVDTVTFDGTTDGALRADDPFYPQTPPLRATTTVTAGRDGAEGVADYDNVAESFGVDMLGGITAARAAVQKLQRLLEHARRNRQPGVLPVYVKFRPDSAEAWYRSQILSGRALWAERTLDWMWPAAAQAVQLIFTRRFFWEADSESELPLRLSGEGGNGSTGGRALTNHDDSGHKNWADIVAGQVLGDLPAAARIEIVNSTAATEATLYLSNEVALTGTAVSAVLEGEAGTGGATQVDANSSGGNFQRLTWSGTSEADLLSWTFAAADLASAAGRWFRAVARFANTFAYTDLWLRFKLTANGVVIWQGNKTLMTPSVTLQEIQNLPLPPALAGLASLNAATIVLQATRIAGGSCTLDVDYVQLLALDSWRKFAPVSGGLANTDALHDDGIADAVYAKVGSNKVPSYIAYGLPLRLEPGYTQRLRMLMARADGSAPIADAMTLRAYYRMRRLTI
jgi:hypothetical protein